MNTNAQESERKVKQGEWAHFLLFFVFLSCQFVDKSLSASSLLADMTVEIQVRQAAATTQPAATTRPTQPTTVESSTSVLAVDGHPFAASFKMEGQQVEISGTITPLADTKFRVHYHFSERSDRSVLQLDSDVEVKLGDEFLLSGDSLGHQLVLTLKPAKS